MDDQVNQRGYGTSSEHMRELTREDQERQQLRALLMAGAASASVARADASYFDSLRERVREAGAKGPSFLASSQAGSLPVPSASTASRASP